VAADLPEAQSASGLAANDGPLAGVAPPVPRFGYRFSILRLLSAPGGNNAS